jgi:hypothetical protein
LFFSHWSTRLASRPLSVASRVAIISCFEVLPSSTTSLPGRDSARCRVCWRYITLGMVRFDSPMHSLLEKWVDLYHPTFRPSALVWFCCYWRRCVVGVLLCCCVATRVLGRSSSLNPSLDCHFTPRLAWYQSWLPGVPLLQL